MADLDVARAPEEAPVERRALRWGALLGIVGLLLCLLGAFVAPRQAAHSYLAAYVAWLTLALGALLMVMIAHAIGTSWFVPMRRIAESVAATLPLFALLFIPILIALPELYPWARPLDTLAEPLREAVEGKHGYFGLGFFIGRAVLYFVIWIVTSSLLHAWSVRRDSRPADAALEHRQRVLAAVALPPVGFALTFAAFDWVMSLAPEWVSTMFGVYLFIGGMVSALALLSVLLLGLDRAGVLGDAVTVSHYHALGKLLLTFVIFWGYIAYAQYFIIWIADIPAEAGWYAPRVRGSWGGIALVLVLGHFALPFLLLLSWQLKRRPRALAAVGAWLVLMHCFDAYWLVLPALYPAGVSVSWLDFAAFIGVGALAFAFGTWRYLAHAPAPVGDPRWQAAREFTTR